MEALLPVHPAKNIPARQAIQAIHLVVHLGVEAVVEVVILENGNICLVDNKEKSESLMTSGLFRCCVFKMNYLTITFTATVCGLFCKLMM